MDYEILNFNKGNLSNALENAANARKDYFFEYITKFC